MYKSSHQRCSVKEGVLRDFAKLTGKHLCQSLFFNKVAGGACIFIKKGLWRRCFPVNFAKFERTPFSQNTSGQLLLFVIIEKWLHAKYTVYIYIYIYIYIYYNALRITDREQRININFLHYYTKAFRICSSECNVSMTNTDKFVAFTK